MLLTETWTLEQSNIDIAGYISYTAHRYLKKKVKRNSEGLVVYIRNKKGWKRLIRAHSR